MFMCFITWSPVINLNLFWKQPFLIQLKWVVWSLLQGPRLPSRKVLRENWGEKTLQRCQHKSVLAKGLCNGWTNREMRIWKVLFQFYSQSLMIPLIQAEVSYWLLLCLCTVSIAACNKLFEILIPFHAE